MARCPECGTEQDTGRFCGHCGAALAAPGRDGSEEDRASDRWEGHGRSRRRWTVGALTAIVIGIVVAAVITARDATRPGTEQAAPDTPVGTTLPPVPASDDPPPRPVTTPGDCPDATPGCIAWHTDFPGTEAVTRPALGNDPRHAYLAGFTIDRAGALYAIDPGNGIQLWRRRLPGPPRTPVVTPWGTVVVVYDDPRAGSGIRGFDPDTGELRWQAEGALASQANLSPAAAGDTLAIAAPDRMLLQHLDGNTVTIVEYEGSPTGLLGGGEGGDATFLVQTDLGEVTAYAPDGSVRWSRTSTVLGTAVSQGRTVLLDLPGQVVGVDIRTGEAWRIQAQIHRFPPTVVGDRVFLTTRNGEIVQLSLTDGRELARSAWPVEIGDRGVLVHEGTMYVPTCAAVIAADADTGQELWATGLEAPEPVCATVPVVEREQDVELLVTVLNRLYGLVPEPSAP